MKSFMILFSGLKNGWVGRVDSYTLTVQAETKELAVLTLSKSFSNVNVRNVRELKPARI